MNERASELRVGVTLTVAGLALILGILWLGGLQLGERRYPISVVFAEVGGLAPGDRVTVAGLEAGEVTDLGLVDGRVLVDIEVDNAVRLPVDSRITVSSYGLIGAKTVAVRPGTSGVYIRAGTTVYGAYEKGLGDVVAEMGEALTEIRQVLKAADEVITDVEGRRRLSHTLENASVAAEDFKFAVADLRSTSATLRTFVDDKMDGAGSAIDSMEEASARFAAFTAELDSMSVTLDEILRRVEAGEGTLGKLIADDEGYDEFVGAAREVKELIAEIRANPKGFVRFSIF
jgi:phospholipid/cholesterol/gamma-HCH transport system substrate-binding protein